jgi:hypothetical protein
MVFNASSTKELVHSFLPCLPKQVCEAQTHFVTIAYMACYGYVYDMLGSMLYTTCLACLYPLVLLTFPKDP